jgi:formate dehydrogenase (NADP+) beta subunit
VFLAIGAHIGKRTEIPARDAGKILDAVTFLKGASAGAPPKLGRRVAIYGGGNTAMDAARTAKRLGYEPLVIYRRDREHMAGAPEEADDAVAEGVKIHWLRTIKTIDATSFTVEVMALDSSGRPQPTGQLETIEADALVLALGQDVDTGFLKGIDGLETKKDGTIVVSPDLMTAHDGIFAGGDMVPSERTVTVAVGHGKKAARSIDAYLRGATKTAAKKHPVAAFAMLHLPFYTDATRRQEQHLAARERASSFEEVALGLGAPEAEFEAKRCLSCGNCFECDSCYAACPEDAIVKLGPGKRYRYDLDRCTGCAVCFEQCPCHAIAMRPEP